MAGNEAPEKAPRYQEVASAPMQSELRPRKRTMSEVEAEEKQATGGKFE